MNAREKVARLEALLARVRSRASETRRISSGAPRAASARPAATESVAPQAYATVAAPPSDLAVAASRPEAISSLPPMGHVSSFPPMSSLPPGDAARVSSIPPMDRVTLVGGSPVSQHPTAPPVTVASSEQLRARAGANVVGEADLEALDVEVTTEVVEVEIDDEDDRAYGKTEEGEAMLSLESDELVAANELEEPAPSSSRRPIADETYEAESAPQHTPPPESGKQVAALPSAPPRASSVPPDSGGTIIGGWKGPVPGEPQLPQINVPSPLGSTPPAARRSSSLPPRPSTTPPPPPTPLVRPPFEVGVAVTRAQLGDATNVAVFAGAAPFTPTTFGDLLDASLSL